MIYKPAVYLQPDILNVKICQLFFREILLEHMIQLFIKIINNPVRFLAIYMMMTVDGRFIPHNSFLSFNTFYNAFACKCI